MHRTIESSPKSTEMPGAGKMSRGLGDLNVVNEDQVSTLTEESRSERLSISTVIHSVVVSREDAECRYSPIHRSSCGLLRSLSGRLSWPEEVWSGLGRSQVRLIIRLSMFWNCIRSSDLTIYSKNLMSRPRT